MGDEVIATWNDDRTDAEKCTVSIKYNGTEVKSGDSFKYQGTLSITISDDEGASSSADISLNVNNNPPKINVIISEINVL